MLLTYLLTNSTHEVNVPRRRRKSRVGPDQRDCYNCGEVGHISRDCKKPKFWGTRPGRETQVPRPDNNANVKHPTGIWPGSVSPSEVRREGCLEVSLYGRSVLALLDTGCEQSVIGRNLIRKVPLEPTHKTLGTADGSDVPLLGKTTIHFSVAGLSY